MPTINVRRYSEPDALREFAPRVLLALLGDHREYLGGKGVTLPPTGDGAEVDLPTLAKVFASPGDMPPKLAERFDLVGHMTGKNPMDEIVETVARWKLPITFAPDFSPADVAAHLFLQNEALFRELYAENAVKKVRAFTSFVTEKKAAGFKVPVDFSGLEGSLNDWYEKHRRGRTARVFCRQDGKQFWFFVRHAEPVKREGCVDMTDHQSKSMIYHPEKHDLVVYDSEFGELRIHADCKKEPELFRLEFGRHLFNDRDFFPLGREKYTLEPLRKAGKAALGCGGIEGMRNVTLKELQFLSGVGAPWHRETHAADDLFDVLAIPDGVRLLQAKFLVRFSDNTRPRTVTIRPSNYALYGRDDDAVLVEKWLALGKFIVTGEATEEDEDGTVEVS